MRYKAPVNTEPDYLVVGCGATALAFVDTMLRETDATFTIVDRRHAPGGHWNDAYPFVRLHQPSSSYGVASRPLGRDRLDKTGFNRGYAELATGGEVTHYFQALMNDVFLPSGRVSFHPLTEHTADGELVGLLSHKRQHVHVRKKWVDATRTETVIPLTHTRKFSTDTKVVCIAPNHLARTASRHDRFAVLGAGKTAIDSVSFLLSNGVHPDAITWVLPRDPWLYNRGRMQQLPGFFDTTIGGLAEQFEIAAAAQSMESLAERYVEAGIWLRLDDDVWPTMMHGATVTEVEVEALRQIRAKVRLGHVLRIEAERMLLDRGEVAMAPATLYVDCTASALGHRVNDTTPVFGPGKISLQMIRMYQPTFSAALIGHIEASISDPAEQRALSRPTPMTDTLEDWVHTQAVSFTNQAEWSRNPNIAAWLAGCRLDAYNTQIRSIRSDDRERLAMLTKMRSQFMPALQNLTRLAAERK